MIGQGKLSSLLADAAPECARSLMTGQNRWCRFSGAPFWNIRSSNFGTKVSNES
jgi:hypothetical protein